MAHDARPIPVPDPRLGFAPPGTLVPVHTLENLKALSNGPTLASKVERGAAGVPQAVPTVTEADEQEDSPSPPHLAPIASASLPPGIRSLPPPAIRPPPLSPPTTTPTRPTWSIRALHFERDCLQTTLFKNTCAPAPPVAPIDPATLPFALAQGDWSCATCGFWNTCTAVRCGRGRHARSPCGARREDKFLDHMYVNAAPGIALRPSGCKFRGDWKCGRCRWWNGKAAACKKCGGEEGEVKIEQDDWWALPERKKEGDGC